MTSLFAVSSFPVFFKVGVFFSNTQEFCKFLKETDLNTRTKLFTKSVLL